MSTNTSIIADGWLILSNGTNTLRLQCEEIEWDIVDQPIIEHYEGGSNVGVGGANIRYIRVTGKGIFVTTTAKYEDLAYYLLLWNITGTFTLRLQINDLVGVAEVSTVIGIAANDLTTGEYFTINNSDSIEGEHEYYVWFNKDGGGGNPAPAGKTSIPVVISTGETAQEVSDAIRTAITTKGDFTAVNGGGTSTTVTITNADKGSVTDIADVDTTMTVATTIQGVNETALEIDGTNTLYTVMMPKGFSKAKKISVGNQTVYYIKVLLFEQTG